MRPLLALVHRYPWLVNVATYGTLFSAADVAQQVLVARPSLELPEHNALDLKQTGKVALVGFTFHANFNYIWFRTLERLLPGANATMVIAKVACDQVVAAPITIGAFYTGLSLLDGESDIFGKLQEKFWPTYKAGVLCWTLFQAVNFTLMPPVLRTAYVGACSFLWTAFLCYLRQSDARDATSRLFHAVPGLAGLFPPTAGESQLLLYLAWLPTGLWSCLQCDKKLKDSLAKFRTEVVERQIHDTRLKERANELLKGLEGNFFRHYTTSQFSGFAEKKKVDDLIWKEKQRLEGLLQTSLTDQALLEELVEFRREMTMKLKLVLQQHQTRACDPNDCAWLQYKVFNCIKCRDASTACLTVSQCFVDSQDRVSLRFGHPLQEPNIAQNGVAIVLSMGGVLFLVIIGVIITYWRNRLFEYV